MPQILRLMSVFKWFYNLLEDEQQVELDTHHAEGKFVLKIDDLVIGTLSYREGYWLFEYSQAFKHQKKFRRLVGFSDLEKAYKSDTLWPFFKLRIPGLKQPKVREILETEAIDATDEVKLLERFGKRNISNPYILEAL